MIQENGWVENDFQKEIGGKKVYVVVAKAPDTNNRFATENITILPNQRKDLQRFGESSERESERKSQEGIGESIALRMIEPPQQRQNQQARKS